MSVTIKIDNFGTTNKKETTSLDADSLALATSLTVKSSKDYLSNDLLLIGRPGIDTTDLCTIASITDTTHIALASPYAKYPHSRFTPVVSLFGDQIQLYRASDVDGSPPADASFAALGSPTTIDFDDLTTNITDSTGSSSYWYKFTYRNSLSSLQTSLADSNVARGGTIGTYCSIQDVRVEAGLTNNKYITDAIIDGYRQEAEAEINSTLQGLYTIPFTAPINPQITFVATLLSAGFCLLKDYGPLNNGSSKDGQKKIDEARAILTRIKNKALILVDQNGGDLSVEGVSGFEGWPNEDTASAEADSGGGDRMFRVSDIY